MFDIAWTEILIIAVIAIIVVGPKELPGMLRAFGRTFGQVRRTAREFQSTFNEALRDAERQAKLDEVRKDLDQVRNIDPAADVKKTLSDTKASLDERVSDRPAARPEPDEPAAPTSGPTTPRSDAPNSVAPDGGVPGASGEADPPRSDVVPLKGGERPAPSGGDAADETGEPQRAAAGERR